MVWLLLAVALPVAAFVVYWWLRFDPTVDNPIDVERLESRLDDLGVEIASTRSPHPALFADCIGADESLDYAIHGKYNRKNAVVCLLDDRIVLGAATVGTAGAERRVVPFDWIDSLEKDYDRGGTLRFVLADETFEITHLPRSQFESFEAELRRRIEGDGAIRDTESSTGRSHPK